VRDIKRKTQPSQHSGYFRRAQAKAIMRAGATLGVPAKPNAKSGMIPNGIAGGRLVKPDLHPALTPTD
jgi:hypothetical protein